MNSRSNTHGAPYSLKPLIYQQTVEDFKGNKHSINENLLAHVVNVGSVNSHAFPNEKMKEKKRFELHKSK